MVDRYKLQTERAKLLNLTLFHQEGVGGNSVLFELGLNEGQCELGTDQRNVLLHLE